MFGNRVEVANGGVSGVPLKSGAVWVKRSASGAVEMVARGFFRTRGLALDEPRGYLYVANEANAWDQGTSGCLSRINLASGEVKKVAVGLDYAQFPSLEASTGRVFVPLALHNKLVVYDPRPASAFAPVSDTKLEERNISAAINGASWEATHPSLPTLSVSIDELAAPATLSAGVRFAAAPSGPAESPSVSVWLRIPADQLDLYKLELPYNDAYHAGPDTFALPNADCRLDAAGDASGGRTAGVCKLSVQPNHEHRGPRWPNGIIPTRMPLLPAADFLDGCIQACRPSPSGGDFPCISFRNGRSVSPFVPPDSARPLCGGWFYEPPQNNVSFISKYVFR